MDWAPIVVGTIVALLFSVFMAKYSHRKTEKSTIEELKRDRNVLAFVLGFTVFWIATVSHLVDLTFLGMWSGAVYAVAVGILYFVVRLIYDLMNRSKTVA